MGLTSPNLTILFNDTVLKIVEVFNGMLRTGLKVSCLALVGSSLNRTSLNEEESSTVTKIVIVKYGGSAITEKKQFETLKENEINLAVRQLASAISYQQSAYKVKYIIIHGAGSFGHFQAKQFNLKQGGNVANNDNQRKDNSNGTQLQSANDSWQRGFCETRKSVTKLNSILVNAHLASNLNAVSCSPFPSTITSTESGTNLSFAISNIGIMNLNIVQSMLERNLVPVFHGDVVMDTNQRCTILSGDYIIYLLCLYFNKFNSSTKYKVTGVVFLADVPGIFDRPPSEPNANLIRNISVHPGGLIDLDARMETAAHDVTGGIKAKLNTAVDIAQLDVPVYIVQIGTEHSLTALLMSSDNPNSTVDFMNTSSNASLAEELSRVILGGGDEGVSDEQLRNIFGSRYSLLPSSINELLSANRLQLFQQGGVLVYKGVREEIAAKFEGLGPEQILVYQTCEKAGNKGIWIRDLKFSTNIPQHTLTKTLKILEQRNLIKSVRSVINKSKKLYMLYDMQPAKDITGGPWYADQEFDHEFVDELSNFIHQIVKQLGVCDLSTISDKIRSSGISKIELTLDEIELVVNTLVYDGRLEEVHNSVLLLTGYATSKKMYKVSQNINPPNFLMSIPCGVCQITHQCKPVGVVSPASCVYLTKWMEITVEEEKGIYSSNQAVHRMEW